MPAEWEPHAATWLAWPHERTDWPGKFAPIPWVYADIVRHLARVERVRILVQNARRARKARRMLEAAARDLARWIFSSCPPIAAGSAISVRSSSRNRDAKAVKRIAHHQLALQRLGQIRRLAER